MLKVLSILLSFQLFIASVLPNIDTHDLDDIPELVKHFNEHKKESKGKELSFVGFLKMHYTKSEDTDKKDHSNLPFKHQHSCSITVAALMPSHNFTFTEHFIPVSKVKIAKSSTLSYHPFFWQPPKFA